MRDIQIEARPYVITNADLNRLMQPTEGPCISIYCATAPAANADQGRIRFKTALGQVEQTLGPTMRPRELDPLLEPLRQMADSGTFWLSQTHGLGVFRSPHQLRVLNLLRDVEDVTIVADSFHVRPLVRIMQPRARFQVLCVSNDRVALYEGDVQRLEEVPLHPDVPQTMGDAIGEPSRVTDPKNGQFVPDDSDTRSRQLTRYFRRLDDAIWEHHSRDSGLPLILAALPEYHGLFHSASRNRQLVSAGIRREPFKEVDAKKLAELAQQAIEPIWQQRVAELRDRFQEAAAHGRGSDDLTTVARQAVFGQVATLLLRQGHRVGGTVDPGTGEVRFKEILDKHVDDLLDDVAEAVLRRGGEVFVLPADQMPASGDDRAAVAAILRPGAAT